MKVKILAKELNGVIDGDKSKVVHSIGDIRSGSKDSISFISDGRYNKYLKDSKSQVIIVGKNFCSKTYGKTLIKVDNPVYAYIKALELFSPPLKVKRSIHKTAIIHPSVIIGKHVNIGPYVVLENGVKIGDNVSIEASSYIGMNSIIGSNCIIHANVTIYHDIEIGHKVIIDAGSVIGTDGFGLTKNNGENYKIPHLGKVIINDNVWIGANCAIDRGTINNTIIGEGTKMDNLIQIAHNVIIGKNCVIAGQSAIAGSTIIGNYVTIAGKVGIIGHLNIGNYCTIASMSQVTKSIKDNSLVSGIPARSHKENLKYQAGLNKINLLLEKLKK